MPFPFTLSVPGLDMPQSWKPFLFSPFSQSHVTKVWLFTLILLTYSWLCLKSVFIHGVRNGSGFMSGGSFINSYDEGQKFLGDGGGGGNFVPNSMYVPKLWTTKFFTMGFRSKFTMGVPSTIPPVLISAQCKGYEIITTFSKPCKKVLDHFSPFSFPYANLAVFVREKAFLDADSSSVGHSFY